MSVKVVAASNESVDFGTGVNFDGTLTTASGWTWFYVVSVSDARMIDKSEGVQDNEQTVMLGITTAGGGTVRSNINEKALSSIETIALNKWHLLVVVADGTNVKLFFNAVEVASAALSSTIVSNARNCRLGSTGFDTAQRNFNGMIADTGLSDEAFSLEFITSMYQKRGAIFVPNRHRWPCNDREGGVTVGASSVHDIGPQALAPGSGTNTPTFDDQNLSFVEMVP